MLHGCYIYPKSGMDHLPLNLKRLSEILRLLSVYYNLTFNTLSQFWLTVRPVLRNLGFYPRYKIGVVFFTRSQMNDSNMIKCSLLGRKFACSSFKWLVNIMHACMVPRDIVTTLFLIRIRQSATCLSFPKHLNHLKMSWKLH